jgi:hypothetical protein
MVKIMVACMSMRLISQCPYIKSITGNGQAADPEISGVCEESVLTTSPGTKNSTYVYYRILG